MEYAGYPSGAAGSFVEQDAYDVVNSRGPSAHRYSEHVADMCAVENGVPGSSNRIETIPARPAIHTRHDGL